MKLSEILQLKIGDCDAGKDLTIKGYLHALLMRVWERGEEFSGKRPFGNSGWEYDLYVPLIKNGVVAGTLDEDGFIEDCNNDECEAKVCELINHCFNTPPPTTVQVDIRKQKGEDQR